MSYIKHYMLRFCIASFLFIAGFTAAKAQVWSTDIAPVLYNNCVSCHRPSGIAPFSLLTYQDAVTFGNAVSSAVSAKRMPPWPPDPSYKRLAHERILSPTDIDKIVSWVNSGKPQGDPVLAPPQPVFSADGDLPGTPDLVTQIPAYTSNAANGDVYQCFVVPGGQAADRFITAFEAVPGNRAIVHHVLVYADTTGICAQLDAASSGPGYTSFGGVGTNKAILIGGWVPGTAPIVYPAGFGVRLPAHSDIVIQIHYPGGTSGLTDSTKIRFFFSSSSNVRPVFIDPVLNHSNTLINGPLFIPANQTQTFIERFTPPALNYSLLGVAPHMHLIGKRIQAFGVNAQGDTSNFIRINNWDFHWQGFYLFKKLQKVSSGTVLYASAFYDNTANNTLNPNNPPQNVAAGEATTDEMMLVYFLYTLYQNGDENIVIDDADPLGIAAPYYQQTQLLEVYPNPAHDRVVIKCYLDRPQQIAVDIISINGAIVKSISPNQFTTAGYTPFVCSVKDLSPGIYNVRLHTPGGIQAKKLVIQP